MSDKAEDIEREELLKQIAEMDAKIKRKVLELMEHPNVPKSFKESDVIKELVK